MLFYQRWFLISPTSLLKLISSARKKEVAQKNVIVEHVVVIEIQSFVYASVRFISGNSGANCCELI